ncbi:Transcriptional regulatory protein OmpR [Saezia sanguinis]|jgi:DNA-binding response OmpR family regulator|uniref:Transcriptional regulatory protein OmpR n=1 Tax=Saezia sanguinis TaxID=1965230 RepID=A0A433SED8_9BURK|nr:response regulator transcription factor [Saezia sanguinis]RUS67103.1 Transcriptional regulatory protein OmpR [Saezia sanguinis]
MPQILLVEDDERLARMTISYLEQFGFSVSHAPTVQKALALAQSTPLNAIILDLMLPDGDGLDVCRQLRGQSSTQHIPIMMLTARGDPTDRIIGLEMGADDYLPKPFEPRELLARLRAILRRQTASSAPQAISRFGRLEIDHDARTVRLDGEEKTLTSYQYDLLNALAQHPGRVLSREYLMDEVKGESLEAFDRSIDVHMSRIRAAIEDDPKHPRRIVTVRGVGYVFAKAQD